MTAIGDQSPSGAKPRSGFDAKYASAGGVANRPETASTPPNIPQLAGKGSIDDVLGFLRGDHSMLKCTVCGAQAGTCDCWTQCACGWSFQKGSACRNPAHLEQESRG